MDIIRLCPQTNLPCSDELPRHILSLTINGKDVCSYECAEKYVALNPEKWINAEHRTSENSQSHIALTSGHKGKNSEIKE